EDKTATGFNQRTLHIYSLTLMKDRHVNAFMDFLLGKLNNQQKHQLVNEAESRLDAELVFFIRIDKDLWADRVFQLTDSGNCYHLKLSVAAFPRKREVALDIATKVFKPH
ncbi:MAG TPA: RNA-binding domain-containing protein, partial [Candidatus Binatia bacterium]|nr:RNA-binding domain-containing protein [Candidatus Binatia bacterium]